MNLYKKLPVVPGRDWRLFDYFKNTFSAPAPDFMLSKSDFGAPAPDFIVSKTDFIAPAWDFTVPASEFDTSVSDFAMLAKSRTGQSLSFVSSKYLTTPLD